MGFGKLFAGYALLFYLPLSGMSLFFDGVASVDVLPNIIGYLFILSGLTTLSLYEKSFKIAKVFTICAAVMSFCGFATVGAYELLNVIDETFMQDIGKYIAFFADILENICLIFFNFFMMRGLWRLADETEVYKTRNRIKRNYFIVIPAIIATIVIRSIAFFGNEANYISALYILFIGIWVFFNSIQIFSCYMWICRPEDKDMLPRDSRLKTPFEVAENTKKRTAERMKNKKKK